MLVAGGLTGCTSPEKAVARSAKGELLKEAGLYASNLKANGKLPGYSSHEHGRLITSALWKSGHVSYPAAVSVRAWKEGDETTYCYELEKDTPDSSWHLTKADHLDRNGKVIEELYPK